MILKYSFRDPQREDSGSEEEFEGAVDTMETGEDLGGDTSDDDSGSMAESAQDEEEDDAEVEEVEVPSGDDESDNSGNNGEQNEEDEDEVVQAIRSEREKKPAKHPPDIKFDCMIADICLHPAKDMIATGLLTGQVVMTSYTNEGNETVRTLGHHKKTCRDIEFSHSGDKMMTASKDHSICICDAESGNIVRRILRAHDSPLCRLLIIDENTFATGDDDGAVKLWDARSEQCVSTFNKMTEYVMDMCTTEAGRVMVCSSGDGCLTAFNLRARRFESQSEEYDSDLGCMALLRSETKLVVGTGVGRMYIFDWGKFGLHTDVYPGHRECVNAVVPITEDIAITALEDGTLRAVHFFPHKYLGIVGQHNSSAEKVDISHSGDLIASSSEDGVVKFWDIAYFEEMEMPVAAKNQPQDATKNLPSSQHRDAKDFFKGLGDVS